MSDQSLGGLPGGWEGGQPDQAVPIFPPHFPPNYRCARMLGWPRIASGQVAIKA
jgi:hypothetical protein